MEYLRVCNIQDRVEVGTLMQHEGTITALEFHSTSHLISGAEDGIICVWDTRSWNLLSTMPGHK